MLHNLDIRFHGITLYGALEKQLSTVEGDLVHIDDVYKDLWMQFFMNVTDSPTNFIKLLDGGTTGNGLPEFKSFENIVSSLAPTVDKRELVDHFKAVALDLYMRLFQHKVINLKNTFVVKKATKTMVQVEEFEES